MTAQRIDVHHHYATSGLIDALAEVGVTHVGGQPLGATRPQDSLAVMDRYEVASALLSVPIPLTVRDPRRVARALNEAGAAAVADAPERFGLLAALPLPDVEGALEELTYALDTLNADGILLLSNYAGVYLGDPYIEQIFAELDRRGAVALVHPTVFTGDRPPVEPNGRRRPTSFSNCWVTVSPPAAASSTACSTTLRSPPTTPSSIASTSSFRALSFYWAPTSRSLRRSGSGAPWPGSRATTASTRSTVARSMATTPAASFLG